MDLPQPSFDAQPLLVISLLHSPLNPCGPRTLPVSRTGEELSRRLSPLYVSVVRRTFCDFTDLYLFLPVLLPPL